jgi:hypothetical protein
MAYSDFSLTDMDMSVCMLDRGRVTLGHYVIIMTIELLQFWLRYCFIYFLFIAFAVR